MARRVRNADGTTGDWRRITYAQALASARSIGQALRDRGLNVERPVAILSETTWRMRCWPWATCTRVCRIAPCHRRTPP